MQVNVPLLLELRETNREASSERQEFIPFLKNPPANAEDTRDTGSIPGSERSPGGGNVYPLQYSCLENSRDRRSWWAIVHGVTKSWTQLEWLNTAQLSG